MIAEKRCSVFGPSILIGSPRMHEWELQGCSTTPRQLVEAETQRQKKQPDLHLMNEVSQKIDPDTSLIKLENPSKANTSKQHLYLLQLFHNDSYFDQSQARQQPQQQQQKQQQQRQHRYQEDFDYEHDPKQHVIPSSWSKCYWWWRFIFLVFGGVKLLHQQRQPWRRLLRLFWSLSWIQCPSSRWWRSSIEWNNRFIRIILECGRRKKTQVYIYQTP